MSCDFHCRPVEQDAVEGLRPIFIIEASQGPVRWFEVSKTPFYVGTSPNNEVVDLAARLIPSSHSRELKRNDQVALTGSGNEQVADMHLKVSCLFVSSRENESRWTTGREGCGSQTSGATPGPSWMARGSPSGKCKRSMKTKA